MPVQRFRVWNLAAVCAVGTFWWAPLSASAGDEIVVIAERRAQARSTVVGSISVIDADAIKRIGADHPAEIVNRAPGVFVQRGSGQEHLTAIRSPVLTGGAGAGSFLYLEDGIPLRSPGFANVNGLLDAHVEVASRVEVGRGPSGALYGANALHGVINVVTPSGGDSLGVRVDASADTIGRLRAIGSFGEQRGANELFVGLSVLDDPGFRADSGVDQQKLSIRHDHEGERLAVTTIFSGVNLAQETAGFIEGDMAYRDAVLRRSNPNPEAFRDARSLRLSSRVDLSLSNTAQLSVTPYVRWSDTALLMHFFPSRALEESSQWGLGAQSAIYIAGAAEGSGAIFGVDWEVGEGALSEVQSRPTIGTFTQGVHYHYSVRALALSPYFKLQAPVTERLTASVAARLDWTRYDYDNKEPDGAVGRFLRPADRRDHFLTVSPKFSVLYDFGEHRGARSTLYASLARGARPPQTSDLYRLQTTQTLDPARAETIDAAELGWRGGVRDRLQFDLAGYFMVKNNVFFRDADGFNVPDGRTRHLGAEAEMTLRIASGLSIRSSTAFGRHTYRFDRPVLSALQQSEAIVAGTDIDTAPRWISNVRLMYTPAHGRASGEVEWARIGRYFTDAANTRDYRGHDVINLRGAYQMRRTLQVYATLRNVLNEFYADRADFAFGNDRYFPAEGRVLSIGLRFTDTRPYD